MPVEKELEKATADVERNIKMKLLERNMTQAELSRLLNINRQQVNRAIKCDNSPKAIEIRKNDTERIHIHGILWGVGLESLIRETWKYGFIFIGQYVTEKTINYITKYMYKKDEKHPTFTGKVLCSAGIGSQYTPIS